MKNIVYCIVVFAVFAFGQTPNQIEQAKKFIKSSGISEAEARKIANLKGYSDEQIDNALKKANKSDDNLETEISDLIISESNTSVNISEELNTEENQKIEENIKIEKINEPKNNTLDYFGYDIFKKDPELFQATSIGTVSPNYVVGPGDQIILMLWGETQFRQLFTVDREGFVFLPEIGQVFVNGLTLSLLESKLFRVLSKVYASLNPNNRKPTTFMDVSLGKLRPLRIHVLGEVSQPGAYTVSPSSSLFSALYYFKGPTKLGSLREIRLIRGNKTIGEIDFYNYLLSGKTPNDEKLQVDDVIFIPKRHKTISIFGEVNRPGIYELKSDEGIKDIIEMAGGMKVTAYLKRGQIDRIVPFSDRVSLGMDRMFIDIDLEEAISDDFNLPLIDGDSIEIFSIPNLRQNMVTIVGAVTRPGTYDIGDKLSLKDLIEKAEGLIGDAHLDFVEITRTMDNLDKELIRVDLSDTSIDSNSHNVALEKFDIVKVYSKKEMKNTPHVFIKGHVKYPGRYLFKENMRLYDLIFKSGALVDEQFKAQIFLERADLIRFNDDQVTKTIIPINLKGVVDQSNQDFNLRLKPGDEFHIYNKNIFNFVYPVTIDGVVKKPGKYELKTGMTLKDLILEAGGVIAQAYKYRIEIARIDPDKLNDNLFAEIIKVGMFNDYSLDDNNFEIDSKSEVINLKREGFSLKPYDIVTVRSDPYFNIQEKIEISGAVYFPGSYTLTGPNEKISDVIGRAGGLRPYAFPEGSTFTRDNKVIKIDIKKIIESPKSSSNIFVDSGDKIFISRKPKMIKISGEISSPGNYSYNKNYRVNDVISLAGGFTQNAEKSDIFITFPNGKSMQYKRFFKNPKVLDGSLITIGKKKESEPFDSTEYAKEISGIIANLAQAISLIIIAKQ